jgi:Fe-S-cluster-containing hydrogenase component 2
MVYINDADCNGCGLCADVCPTGALMMQNNHAFIHQEFCEKCEICLDACPQGAILAGEYHPASREVIRIPAVLEPESNSLTELAARIPLREMVLPAIGSVLVWTGRELMPRLADLALGVLDRRIQIANSVPNNKYDIQRRGDFSTSARARRRGRRRQRRAMRNRKS